MTTVSTIVTQALRDAGVVASGETPTADESDDALQLFAQMIGQWQVDKIMVPGQQTVSVNASGSQTYTIGPSATINTPLPVAVDAAFYRLNDVDYPVHVLTSWEDYESITLKSIPGTIPSAIFYRREAPTGTIYVWPQPSTGSIRLVLRQNLTDYDSLADDISLPKEYELALRLSLQELILEAFNMPPKPTLIQRAKNARKVLMRNNLQLPILGMPVAVINSGRFSIYTGE